MTDMPDSLSHLNDAKERARAEIAAVDAAYAEGSLDDDAWHAAMISIVERDYLRSDDPRVGSGFPPDPARWERARRLLIDALPGHCIFLDVGCANGYLMQSMVEWAAEDGLVLEPYGIDISERLAAKARERYPEWSDRIWTANAMTWKPPRRFDVVRTHLGIVPPPRRPVFLRHLLDHVVERRGRVIVGVYNEKRHADAVRADVQNWGFEVAGLTWREHPRPGLAYKAIWVEAVS